MEWTSAIEQLRSEGYFGDIILFHNGSSRDKDGTPISYEELDVLEDSTSTDVKPAEAVLIDAYARWKAAELTRVDKAKRGIWAFSEEEALAYIDSNVTDIASAKSIIKEMAQMLVAIRSQLSG